MAAGSGPPTPVSTPDRTRSRRVSGFPDVGPCAPAPLRPNSASASPAASEKPKPRSAGGPLPYTCRTGVQRHVHSSTVAGQHTQRACTAAEGKAGQPHDKEQGSRSARPHLPHVRHSDHGAALTDQRRRRSDRPWPRAAFIFAFASAAGPRPRKQRPPPTALHIDVLRCARPRAAGASAAALPGRPCRLRAPPFRCLHLPTFPPNPGNTDNAAEARLQSQQPRPPPQPHLQTPACAAARQPALHRPPRPTPRPHHSSQPP
jgi:hypothetical protein